MAYERRSFSTAAAPTTLTVGIDNAVTSITVQDGSTYVDGALGKSVLTIDRGKSNEERFLYTSRVGNTFSGLTRGYNGTTAQAHSAGAIVEHTSTQQDFDEGNAHLADASLDHHSQYLRTDGTRTNTGVQKYNSLAGTTHQSNLSPSVTQVYGRGLALATDGATHQGGVTAGISVSINRLDPALSLNNASGKLIDGYAGATEVIAVNSTGAVVSAGDSSFFGTNALGATGSRVRVGSLGDAANAYTVAEGSAADVGLILKTKGTGTTSIKRGDDTPLVNVLGIALTGNQSALQVLFNTVGARSLELGAADSGGTGYRTVRVAN